MKFLEELVYDLILPAETMQSKEVDEHSDEVSNASSMQRSSVASSTIHDEKEWDFTCDSGQQDYLTDLKVTAVTKKRLACNYF